MGRSATSDRIIPWFAGEWKRQHMWQGETDRISELIQSYCHSPVSKFRLIPIRSHQSVPPRHIEPEIAIRFKIKNRVMHPVHVGSNHEEAQHSVNVYGDKQVAVIKHGSSV